MRFKWILHVSVLMLYLGVRAEMTVGDEGVNVRLSPEEDETTMTSVGRRTTAHVGRVESTPGYSTGIGATTRIGRTGSSLVRGTTSRGGGGNNKIPIFARVGAASPERESWLELGESGTGDSSCVLSMTRVESMVLLCAVVTLTESVILAATNGTVTIGCGAETEEGMCVIRRSAELRAPALVIGESTRDIFFSNIRFEDESTTATFFMEAEHAPALNFENVLWDSKAGFVIGKEYESLVLSLALSMLPFGVPISFGNDTTDDTNQGVLPYALDGPSPRMLLFAQVLVIPSGTFAPADQAPIPLTESVAASLRIAADSSGDAGSEKENAALICTLDGDVTSERVFSLDIPGLKTTRYGITIDSPSRRRHTLICETVV